MFERRLKIFLGILIGITLVLLVRAAHLQLANGDYWRKQASEAVRRRTLLEPVRGRIVDFKGNVLAEDVACIDAAVDYRAIDLNLTWLSEQAQARLNSRLGVNYKRADKESRKKMLDEEIKSVKADIANLWVTLAKVSGQTLEQIEETKLQIRRRVEMRKRYLWYNRYKQASKSEEDAKSLPWYKGWRIGGQVTATLDNFNTPVSEETEAHVIVHDVRTEINNQLKKRLEQFPGLVLRPSKHRYYPYGEVACHVIGHLTAVEKTDMENNPNQSDELLQYLPNDRIGRSGAEALCELTLRGKRGRIERLLGHDDIYSQQDSAQGNTVRLTIDINLQNDLENAFKRVIWRDPAGIIVEDHQMHGAAVVIDIPTGEVRALVSYPTYDLNHFDELYKQLATNYIDNPLLNRATQMAYEPGSTVKPIVGAAGVSEHVVTLSDGIECTGYLVIDGRPQLHGRCWTASNFAKERASEVAHHQLGGAPHPTGFLTLTDAIERSCNVYFETVGDRLGMDRLSHWYAQFGLGSKTEIGLPEVAGMIPTDFQGPMSPAIIRPTTWFASIGQGQVLATPLQMANVAATIGRNGVWMRPKLVVDTKDIAPATTRPTKMDRPQRVALAIAPETIAAIQEGMYRVVDGSAGTGKVAKHPDIVVCGKTGTAQANFFTIPRLDASGELLRDEKNKIIRDRPAMNTRETPNPLLPWYRGTSKDTRPHHAWFIAFAPREKPRIAIAIMLEYGGSGHDAAALSKTVLDACIKYQYLP